MNSPRYRGARPAWLFLICAALALAACGKDEATPATFDNNTSEPDAAMEDLGDPDPDMGGVEDVAVSDDVGTTPIPDFAFPPIPRDVDTQVVSPVRAGDELNVTCRLLDDEGVVVDPQTPPEFTVAVFPRDSFVESGGIFTAIRTGAATVRCAAPELGLVDQSPAELEILPGPPHTSIIDVSSHQVTAGDTVSATCRFLDEWGNDADPATDMLDPELSVTPSGGGIDVAGFDATITVADVYTMSCFVPGLTVEQQVAVEVVPGLPAQIVASAVPNQPVFALGQVVSTSWVVSDQYGNVIPNAPITTTVGPTNGTSGFGSGRYRFDEEGTFVITVVVDGPTEGNADVSTTVTVVINGDGPGINCDDPVDGSMVDMSPGALVAFEGSVADANGVDTLLINGSSVTVADDGSFSTLVPTQWGINFVEVVATDQFGEENSRTCSFLVSDYYASQSTYMDDAVALKLRQPSIDDVSRSGGITSLADLLHTVLNSQGLLDEVDSALSAANPLQPFTCESETCIFGLCVCWFGWGLQYDDGLTAGARSVAMDLVTGGVDANARIEDLGVRVYVPYVVAEIGGSTDGWVYTDFADIDLTLDIFLDTGNNVRASIRPGSVDVQMGSISTQFSGLDGAIVNGVVSLFNGFVRDLLADTLQGFIEDSFDEVIDGVVSSLDINTLGSTFNVPQLDGTGSVGVRFNLRFSRVSTTSSRLAVGVGTRFTPVSTANSSPTLGVARRHNTVWSEPSTTDDLAIGVYVGILNHVLHALWRGGLFDATIDGGTLGLPAGTTATITSSLPPVVDNLSDGTVKLGLGGLNVALVYPGLFDDPLFASLGAIASSSVTLQGDDLAFGGINIDELYFSTPNVSLDASTRAVLEGFLLQVLQSYIDSALNQSLPALPIPSFTLPQSISQYGLPAGAELGIIGSSLTTNPRQYVLEGSFGVR